MTGLKFCHSQIQKGVRWRSEEKAVSYCLPVWVAREFSSSVCSFIFELTCEFWLSSCGVLPIWKLLVEWLHWACVVNVPCLPLNSSVDEDSYHGAESDNSVYREKDRPKLSGCINKLKQLATKSGRITGYAKLPMNAYGMGWPTSASTTGAGTLRRQLTSWERFIDKASWWLPPIPGTNSESSF